MSSFLRQVAQYFQSKSAIHDYCFVMPNHRSCKFLERELDLASDGVYLMPEVITITDFLASLTDRVPVKPVEALFLLHQCYTSIAGNENYEFDKFIYWGNVVLNDFNDVDMYLVDPKDLFKNLKEHHEIQSNYLDEDLQKIVSHYFNLSVGEEAADSDNFWRNNYKSDGADEDGVKAKYLKLWQSLYQLYEKYHNTLEDKGLCTMGRMYRDAVDAVKEKKFKGNEKFVFVGFNMLTTCELAILKLLKQKERALFFWDLASAAFVNDEGINNGSKFVKFFRQEFPEPSDFNIETATGFPEIEVVGVPSNVGQAKYCYHLLNELINKGILNSTDAINTALILPDDGLLVPLLNSLPPEIDKKNVTMGYPLSASDIASLMRVVAKMHHQARRNDGEWAFYRGDVKIVLSHPIVKNFFGDDALELRRVIAEKGLFAVPQSTFAGTKLESLFTTIDQVDNAESVNMQLKRYINFCQKVIEAMKASQRENIGDEDDIDFDSKQPVMTLQEAFLNQYIEVLNQLIAALSKYKVPSCETSLFYLLDRLAAAFSIPFEGEPLQGLQIMGMLETRCLDFENIIILSANEGMMPGKTRRNSFISDFMRRNYAMSTTADQEMMWNYNFYRLIGRAKRLFMVYDTSDQSMGGGEVTRYVPQLEMVYGREVKRRMFTISSTTSDPITIEVAKRGHALRQLETFLSGKGENSLSASTIKEYINCPLMFYFNKIERLRANDDDVDFMDAGTFGSIVHDTLQHLYYPMKGDGSDDESRTNSVSCANIKNFIKNKLDGVIETLVKEEYLHNNSNLIVGEASIVSVAIKNYVMAALIYDINLLNKFDDNASFTVVECEKKHKISLNYGGVDFDFTYIADRIDRLPDGTLRIVDYKTGKDDTNFTDVKELFEITSKDKNLRGILQLMLYCNAYALEKKTDAPIMPVIYKLRDMSQAGVLYNGSQLEDYHTINACFNEEMDGVISSLFDTSIPFKPSSNNNSCRFCKYIDFCRR